MLFLFQSIIWKFQRPEPFRIFGFWMRRKRKKGALTFLHEASACGYNIYDIQNMFHVKINIYTWGFWGEPNLCGSGQLYLRAIMINTCWSWHVNLMPCYKRWMSWLGEAPFDELCSKNVPLHLSRADTRKSSRRRRFMPISTDAHKVLLGNPARHWQLHTELDIVKYTMKIEYTLYGTQWDIYNIYFWYNQKCSQKYNNNGVVGEI